MSPALGFTNQIPSEIFNLHENFAKLTLKILIHVLQTMVINCNGDKPLSVYSRLKEHPMTEVT